MKPETRYAKSGEVHIAYQVTGSGLRFADRGSHVLKGVPGEWRIFALDRLQPAATL
jgi:hypothetical protein